MCPDLRFSRPVCERFEEIERARASVGHPWALVQAAEYAREGLQLWPKAQDTLQMTFPLESLALIAASRGDVPCAARIVG